jgi:hypothetical protein
VGAHASLANGAQQDGNVERAFIWHFDHSISRVRKVVLLRKTL